MGSGLYVPLRLGSLVTREYSTREPFSRQVSSRELSSRLELNERLHVCAEGATVRTCIHASLVSFSFFFCVVPSARGLVVVAHLGLHSLTLV